MVGSKPHQAVVERHIKNPVQPGLDALVGADARQPRQAEVDFVDFLPEFQ
jgi:hypothetical protein